MYDATSCLTAWFLVPCGKRGPMFILAVSVLGSLYDVTPCLAAWSYVPSNGGLCEWFHIPSQGVSVQGASVQGVSVRETSWAETPPVQ